MPSTLKEFLVALGFKVDDAGVKRFSSAVGNASVSVAKLGTLIASTATAIELGVQRIAGTLEDLFYASMRTGASVRNIQSFGYAAAQIGVSVGEARAALEGFARSMRSNPGVQAFIEGQFGVRVRGRDTTDVMTDVLRRLQSMSFYLAQQYGQMMGLNPDTLFMLLQGLDEATKKGQSFRQFLEQSGASGQGWAERFKDFNNQVRDLGARFDVLTQLVAQRFLPIASQLIDWAKDFVNWLVRLDKETDGWSTMVVGVAAGLTGGAGALTLLTAGFGGLAAAIGGAGAAVAGLLGSLALLAPYAALLGLGHGGAVPPGSAEERRLNEEQQKPATQRDAPFGRFYRWMFGGGNKSGFIPGLMAPDDYLAGSIMTSRVAGQRMMQELSRMGWSRAAAAGLTANVERESGFDPRAKGDSGKAFGIAQWHPERQAAFAQWAGHDIRDSTMQEQLAFMHYELTQGAYRKAGEALRNARSPEEAGAIVSRMYEMPRDTDKEAALRGGTAQDWFNRGLVSPMATASDKNVTVNQKTEILLGPGVDDPRGNARAVAREQDRVNGDLVRNTAGAVR